MRPMLATRAAGVPAGEQWAHEVKWDGMRVLLDVREGSVEIRSRTERDVTVAFPELLDLGRLFPDMLLDGEAVVLIDGAPSFAGIAERFGVTTMHAGRQLAARRPVTLMAFDLLRLYGVDLTGRPWTERRATLERLELGGPGGSRFVQVPPVYDDGDLLLAATREQGLEGIVSKRRSSRYLPGTRSPDWLKLPHRDKVSVVIGGWRQERGGTGGAGGSGSAGRLGALLVGVPGRGGLRFVGRVGAGLAGTAGARLLADLLPLEADRSPFADELPREDRDGARWVHPVVVADVESLGMSSGGRLRQPTFAGLRPDLTAGDVDADTR